jgi:Holliday junction resolvase-like predicted endonuclease
MIDLKSKVLKIQSLWLRLVRDPDYPFAASTIRTVLDLLTELMYIEPGQFILEFLQNAEDALMEAGRRGYFKIELYKDRAVVSNDGKPFDEKDLESLCAIVSKKKPALGYKGFIGIGWKSVYKVSNHVEICSGETCFEFNEEFWRRPEAQEILKKYGVKSEEVLWQVTPILVKSFGATSINETRFTVYLKDPSLYGEIVKTLNELGPSIFLFLDYVNKVIINDYVSNKHKRIEWFVNEEDVFNDVKVRVVKVYVADDGSTKWYDFLVLKKEFKVPEDVRKDSITIKAKRSDVAKREVAIAFELDPAKEDLKPIEEARFWGMYSFLPLAEVRTGLKFLIQADFIVHPGRRYINVEAKWNHWIMQCLAELLRNAIDYVRKKFKKSYLPVFDYRPTYDEIWYKLVEPYIVRTINEILRDPIVLCYKGHEVKLSRVIKASEEVGELIKYGFLDEEDLRHVYGVEKHILHPEFKLREIDERNVPKLTLVDLLNENLIRVMMGRGLEKAIIFLSKIYELAYKRGTQIPPDKRFIITSSGELKLASNVYIPRIPQHITEISKKFPEVETYLKFLDFVHEEMIKLIGEDILKQLGVKEVSLREIAEKVILKQVSAKSPLPDKGRLLIATLLIKQAGLVVAEPIWVLTKDRSIKSSDSVWNPELFTGLEDVVKLLDIELLDIDAYTRYDGDVEGWRRFFEKVVRGYGSLHECYYYYTGTHCILHRYVWDLINKVREALESASIDDNIKLVRLLYRLWLRTSPAQWSKIRVKLVTDVNSFAYSDQLLLHDIYGAAEQWFKWKSMGFPVGPFVTPKYLEKPEDAASWRKFLVEVLGVSDSVSNEVVERFAEWFVEKKLIEKGYRVVGRGGECDLKVDVGGEVVCIEVKGRRKSINEVDVELTENEVDVALKLKNKYWLAVVESIPNSPRGWILRNPANLITRIKIYGEDIRRRGEVLG